MAGDKSGGNMSETMGTFRVDIELENPARPGRRVTLRSVLVDTGAELSWVPAEVLESLGIERYNVWRFRQADGRVRARAAGAALVHVAGRGGGGGGGFGPPGSPTPPGYAAL